MNDTSSDDILLLKQRLAEQEAVIHVLLEKLADREREIDHLQAQLDKLSRMNSGSRSEDDRQHSARCVRSAPANRTWNHSLVTKNDCCRQRHAVQTVAVR